MLNEWTDRMAPQDAAEIWRRQVEEEVSRRTAKIERELRQTFEQQSRMPEGFYEAMQHFLTLHKKVFPTFPADPAWRILVTLAQTSEESGKSNITGIAHGAEIPQTTVLRYLAAMEVEGIIERVPHPDDGRQAIIRLTPEGQSRLDAIADKSRLWLLLVFALPAAFFFVWSGLGIL